MERYIWDLIVLSVRTIIWLFMATVNTGPWLLRNFMLYLLMPIVGRDRVLAMGAGATIPIGLTLLTLFWGGIWLFVWGALGAPEASMWGAFFGMVSGWRAGVQIADELEQVREEMRLEEADNHTPERIEERGIASHAGMVNINGFDIATMEDDGTSGNGHSNGANGASGNGSVSPGEVKKNPLKARTQTGTAP